MFKFDIVQFVLFMEKLFTYFTYRIKMYTYFLLESTMGY